jgi:hypothetical protein
MQKEGAVMSSQQYSLSKTSLQLPALETGSSKVYCTKNLKCKKDIVYQY